MYFFFLFDKNEKKPLSLTAVIGNINIYFSFLRSFLDFKSIVQGGRKNKKNRILHETKRT